MRVSRADLATSPERELSTLNAAIVNVRKWLKKKHESLQSLQRSHDIAVQSTDNKLQADNTDLTTQHSDQALLEVGVGIMVVMII